MRAAASVQSVDGGGAHFVHHSIAASDGSLTHPPYEPIEAAFASVAFVESGGRSAQANPNEYQHIAAVGGSAGNR